MTREVPLTAEEKIEEARQSEATELSLEGMRLTKIPETLAKCVQLKALDLSFNPIRALPKWLGEFRHLRMLDLSSMGLAGLSESMRHLTQLVSLNLSDNDLSELPKWISELKDLRTLDAYRNQLQRLPDALCDLALERLSLSANPLLALPRGIGRLENLRSLTLSDTRVGSPPLSFGRLSKLEFLALGRASLTQVPEALGELVALQGLYLANTGSAVLVWDSSERVWEGALHSAESANPGFERLPRSLTQLTSLKELYLHGNDLLKIPVEILGPSWEKCHGANRSEPADPRTILAFYFASIKAASRPLNEVKLLLVGHGRVGKTSLSKAMRGVPHNDTEPETPGIERCPLQLGTDKPNITAHVWDFGGQEFLHQTHQFFFSERSIYLVVLGGRQGRPMQEAEYWLRLIRTYGTDSPVVIALNQIEAHPFSVDEYYLRENYPEVQAVIETDCNPHVGIDSLRETLRKLAAGMPSVREKIDPGWERVRVCLEQMRESFVSFEKYRGICTQEGVQDPEEQETLATILDCLGIALNYRRDARLRDTSVLKPRWLVDGIYAVLRWLHQRKTNGEMHLEDFSSALEDKTTYPPEMHRFLLALMEKFELCFPVETERDVYLVPGLLSANQPLELRKFIEQKSRRIQFRYEDVRPPSLLPRFIVRSHTLSESQPRWLRGVVLTRGNAHVLVRGDHEGRVTDVFALGELSDRLWLTEYVLSEMSSLHDQMPVRAFVESEGQPGAWTELELLRQAIRRAEVTRVELATDGRTVVVNVRQTLAEVESSRHALTSSERLPLFICYSHTDERIVRQLIPSLKVLARRGYIVNWRDTDLVPGDDWDETIKERLSEAKVILFMVSREFLASKYITEQERPLAMALMKEKKAVVVPVLLSACSWEKEDFARVENLPRKGELVSSFRPRENAWALVEEGIASVVQMFRKRKDAEERLAIALGDAPR